LLSAPNGFELRALARQPGLRLYNSLAQVIEPHPGLHERLAHLRNDRAARIPARGRATQQIAECLANFVKHAGPLKNAG
jgi:hypothetical protein